MIQKRSRYNVCVVGAGAVGIEILRVLKQRRFPIDKLTVLARSARTVEVDGETYQVRPVSPEAFKDQHIVLFAGTEGEKGAAVIYAKEAIRQGAVCIDNGADFRMDPGVPLVVPEVNPEDVKRHQGLIANPNCSTIQMVAALAPVHKKYGIRRIIVSTYQAASGAGSKAVSALAAEISAAVRKEKMPPPEALPQQIAFNVFPHIGPFQEMGYTSEEWKMVKETRKILHDENIQVTATAVRVPVSDAHSESVYVETKQPASIEEIKQLWKNSPGILLIEEPDYPMPIRAAHRDEVFVGRVRPDPSVKGAFCCWIVSDNLRKGAALNAVQIAELLI
ncbi:MAG: aspartate-semialdehyde dehydrogenase [Candidatus Omnitrophica bacterium]|nr:aspartate-semialdehyde dehydrogenase [Candidatus Omnitrophota bacterium]